MTKDKDFEQLIVDFQQQQPSAMRLERWKRTLRSATGNRRSPWSYVAAGLAAGLILGVIISRGLMPSRPEENFSATYVLYDVKNF
ncbi:MAG: hypothetical protein C5B49_15485 [Bdellovibrio sp.]|nr:MAG: hypothetical protein C5B49_15485 [Bdellovibrio sp.]